MTNFLPQNYEQPTSNSSYTKIELGENRVRIIGNPIFGYIGWVMDGANPKPLRVPFNDEAKKQLSSQPLKDPLKHFWALPIWNFKSSIIEIFEITQKTIQNELIGLNNGEWGDPKAYDILITKSGSDLDTKYKVTPSKNSQMEPDKVRAELEAKPFDIEKLYASEDPWDLSDAEKATALNKIVSEFNDLPF